MMKDAAHGHDRSRALLAVGIALIAALFFTMTYVLNRVSATGGGHWAWTACLRYFITLPMLLPLMSWQGGMGPVWRAMVAHPWAWLRCSVIGFLLFYCLLSFAASSGPSWLIAGSFQFTVIAGMLCAPFIYRDKRKRIPLAAV
ncbi:multidrug resistance efflux transporter family protein, partial [Verrucomicrobium sp. BvORR106]|uniref:multidrug resistance efflux transporter family protein n=1 Tax=Verrucomicrobium sp. BvORR106 TaxID=1403819 RepID=UPI002240FDD5